MDGQEFEANIMLYCVYETAEEVTVIEIPAMRMVALNGAVFYKLSAPYFVSALVSTDIFEQAILDRVMKLQNGKAIYTADKVKAYGTAKQLTEAKINVKTQEMKKLKEDIKKLKDHIKLYEGVV